MRPPACDPGATKGAGAEVRLKGEATMSMTTLTYIAS